LLLSLPLDWNEWWMGSLRSRCALWTWGHWISVPIFLIQFKNAFEIFQDWWEILPPDWD
jgi:hypothetical protein